MPDLPENLSNVIIGVIAMGFAVAGLFFLRFWRQSGDRLFAFFAGAFFVLAINRVAAAEIHGAYPFWIRLLAFAMILAAILDKNLIGSRATK